MTHNCFVICHESCCIFDFLGSLRLLSANGFELLVFLEGFFGLLQKLGGKKENIPTEIGSVSKILSLIITDTDAGSSFVMKQQFRGKKEELCNLNITFE